MNQFSFRSALRALLPAALLLASCSKEDKPTPPVVPDRASVLTIHAAANNSANPIKATIGGTDGSTVAYGASSAYQSFGTGTLAISATIAAAGGAVLFSGNQSLVKDKAYSFFVYNLPSQAANTAAGLFVEDDLTAPTVAGSAKVRLVHVGQSLVSPLGLSKPDASGTGTLTAVVPPVAAGASSTFVNVPAGMASYNLVNATGNTIVPLFGAAVLSTDFAAGKIYTIVVRGASPAATDNEKFTLTLITHN